MTSGPMKELTHHQTVDWCSAPTQCACVLPVQVK
jgi:hypothetical protein